MLFERIGNMEKVQTAYGESDCVRADVTVLDAPDGPIEFHNSLIFGAAMAPTVARSAGRMLLGRVGQGTPPRPGQSPPWILLVASDADKQTTSDYLDRRNSGQFDTPAPAPVAATPAPVAAAPVAATPQAPMVDVSTLTPEQLQALLNAQTGK